MSVKHRTRKLNVFLCRHYRASGGFTLPEILIAAVLVILLMSMIIAFLVPAMRASVLGSTRAEIQQEAIRALNKVCDDMENSASAGISLFTSGAEPEGGPVYLGIVRLADVDAQGRQVWEEKLIVYSWQGEGEPVIRKEWSISSPPPLGIALSATSPIRVLQPALASIAQEPGLTGQILARDVAEFRITNPGVGGSVSSPVKLLIRLSREEATGRTSPETFELSRSITLRNKL